MKVEFELSKVEVAKSTTLQTNSGSKYTSRALKSFLAGEGITHCYTPQQNGLSKSKYWAEVFFFALFIIDNLTYSPNGGETPNHYLHHARNPSFDNKTSILGQEMRIHDPDAGIFNDKPYKGIFLGVGQHRGVKGFRIQAEDDLGTNHML
ncbi:hypothetical protein NBRC10513_001977 [Rhodotorula toruloides]